MLGWSGAASIITSVLSPLSRRREILSPEQVAAALYRGILEREPDSDGFQAYVQLLRSGQPLERAIRSVIASPEFRSRILEVAIPVTPLPDLRASIPTGYETQSVAGAPMTV